MHRGGNLDFTQLNQGTRKKKGLVVQNIRRVSRDPKNRNGNVTPELFSKIIG